MTEPQQSAEEAVAEVTYRAGERFYGTENAAKYWASREALIARLETAEQRAEKAEAWVLEHRWIHGEDWEPARRCFDCGWPEWQKAHSGTCYVAELESRQEARRDG